MYILISPRNIKSPKFFRGKNSWKIRHWISKRWRGNQIGMRWKTYIWLKDSYNYIGNVDFNKIQLAHLFRTEIQKTDVNTKEVIYVSPLILVVIKKKEKSSWFLHFIRTVLTRPLSLLVSYKRQLTLRQLWITGEDT